MCLALWEVCLHIECSHKPNSASATPNQVPMTRGAPTLRPTSSIDSPNRAALPSSLICAYKYVTVPLVAHTSSAHTNKCNRCSLALRWYRNIPVHTPRRLCFQILYAHTRTRVIAKQLDVNVTSPHRECTCFGGYRQAVYLVSLAVD